jgi:hypothetical protein
MKVLPTPASLFLLLPLAGCFAPAAYRYNWATGTDSGMPVPAGRPVEITIEGLNPLCFDQRVEARVIDSPPDLSRIGKMFAPAGQVRGVAEGAAEAEAATGETVEGILAVPTGLLQKGFEEMPSARNEALLALARAERTLAAVSARLTSLHLARTYADDLYGTLDNPPCHRGYDPREFFARWDSRQPVLQREFAAHGTTLEESGEQIESALATLDTAAGIVLRSPGNESLEDAIGGLATRAEVLETLRRALRDTVPALAGQLESRAAVVRGLEPATRRARTLDAGVEAGRIEVAVQSTPRQHVRDVQPLYDTTVVALRRSFRSFFSTGAFITFMDPHDYERTNRPFIAVDTTSADSAVIYADSTYSTYANRSPGVLDVFSPALQYNLSFADVLGLASGGRLQGVPLLVTLGAAARTVNKSTLPEPFFGFSAGLADRFVFSLGWHYGRDEVLLLKRPGETDAEIAERRVPSAVTDSDALGSSWNWHGFVTFSVRID